MSDARSAILNRLAQALGRSANAGDPQIEVRLRTHPRGPQPTWPEPPLERFLTRLAAVAGNHVELDSAAQLPAAVADYLAAHNLPPRLVMAPHPLLDAVAPPADWEVQRRHAMGDDRIGLTVAFCGIAETGSLMLLAGADSPTTLNFLPDDFLCLLPANRIVADMEAAWELLREAGRAMPRAVNFVSGPSRTADVEQTIQLGAHGPRRLHVLLLR